MYTITNDRDAMTAIGKINGSWMPVMAVMAYEFADGAVADQVAQMWPGYSVVYWD